MAAKIAAGIVIVVVVIVAALQLAPYGRDHTNPPVREEPPWQGQQTRALLVRACFDCHSNETTWPWYSNVAPLSWLIQNDVQEGRAALNFSEWSSPPEEAGEAIDTVREGEMPPWSYLLTHPGARLSGEELQTLIQGLEATFGAPGEGGEGD